MRYLVLGAFLFLPQVTGYFSDNHLHFSGGESNKALNFSFKSPAQQTGKTAMQDTAALKQSSWYANAVKSIEESEYEIKAGAQNNSFAAPNRKQNLRSTFTPSQFCISPRNDSTEKWSLQLTTLGIYSGNQLVFSADEKASVSQTGKTIRFNHQNNFTTEFINSKEGVRQNFIISKKPVTSAKNITVKLAADKSWYVNKVHDKEIHFAKETQTGYDKKITYNSLKAWDAENRELDASFSVKGNEISINVNAVGAIYPITVDPLSSTANWTSEANQAIAYFGRCVISAGDVNGDGYSDVAIGADQFDNGESNEGKAFVYYGSSTGLSSTPDWTDESNQVDGGFGYKVATAGDINSDGYSDVIIGSISYSNGESAEGGCFVYYGSAIGLSSIPGWTSEGNQNGASYGSSVNSAGDINGDGYSDVIIGANSFDNGENDEGKIFVYYGSASGLPTTPNWTTESNQVSAHMSTGSCAGDVNGDGYSDVIIGARDFDNGENDEGKIFVYYGAAGGLSIIPNWATESNQTFAQLGWSVSSAGDINGDGYGDIIAGAPYFTNGGKVLLFYGSLIGLAATPDWTMQVNVSNSEFGNTVSTGDVNGDGYSDVLVGAMGYSNGEIGEGAAFVYHGSPSGLTSTFAVSCDAADQVGALLGVSVAGAGDINSDGYSDIMIAANSYNGVSADEGRVFVYHGSANGLGTTFNYFLDASDLANSFFGKSVAPAGDVNGDGYADVIIGSHQYNDGANIREGRAYVYYGHAAGLSLIPDRILDDANQPNSEFGNSVAGAGDVNGDGFSDVIVGAYFFDAGSNNNEGKAYIYHGSASGLSATPTLTLNPTNQASALFANSVSSAGDVNGDGYSDIVVGAYFYSDFDNVLFFMGRAYVYHGSPSGINPVPVNVLDGPAQDQANFGSSVASAGDVNGDGFSDVIIGAFGYDDIGSFDEGRAWIYYGSAAGLNVASPATLDAANQINTQYGTSVASAGDVNGDGYSDVLIGAPLFDDGFADEGKVFLFYGSATGVSATADYNVADANQSLAQFGNCVASAGDVNGDGFSDVIIGAQLYNDGVNSDEGKVFVYYGNNGGGIRNNLRLYNTDLTTPIQQSNVLVPNLFGAGLYSKSFLGRTKGKMVWEVKKQGEAFSGSPITNSVSFLDKQSNFSDLGTAGMELKNPVQKVGFQNKIRARVEYNKATAITGQVYGPWRYPVGYLQGGHGMHSVPLPVTLVSLNAQWLNENNTQVNWITTNENNLSHYIVERSTDGIHFTDAGKVFAKGSNGLRTSYSFDDLNIPTNAALVYYRLLMVEHNGMQSFSKIITLNRSLTTKVTVLPNPVQAGSTAVLQIEFWKAATSAYINIYTANGQLAKQLPVKLQKGTNTVLLNTESLPAGIYTIVTQVHAERLNNKLIIQ